MGISFQDLFVGAVTRGIGFLSDARRHDLAEKMASRQAATDHDYAQTVVQNLAAVFPAFEPDLIQRLTLLNCRRMARARLDHLWAWSARASELKRLVRLNGTNCIRRDEPVIIVGAHQLGMEVAAMRLSMHASGGVIVDAGAEALLASARRAWRRFGEHSIIEASGAIRGSLRVLAAGRPLLVFPDEPENADVHCCDARIAGARFRYSPIVSILARRTSAQVLWMQVDQDPDGGYEVGFEPLLSSDDAADERYCAQVQANRLYEQLRVDPSAYWWSRRRIGSAAQNFSPAQTEADNLVAAPATP